MKHQYFGDVNDYRKYGLLRALQRTTGLRLGVCWMLTPDDGSKDGNFTDYLARPQHWRRFDPELFDHLAEALPIGRYVDHVGQRGMLPNATFVDAIVPDRATDRTAWFENARRALGLSQLVFFDPDNGFEINSCPPGRKHSSKYLQWREARSFVKAGRSILVYQHFPREERTAFIANRLADLRVRIGAAHVSCFRTANVAFFLAGPAEHRAVLVAAEQEVDRVWGGEIELCASQQTAPATRLLHARLVP